MIAVLKREIIAYFTSPIGYVFVAVCMLTSGWQFHETALRWGSTDLSATFQFMFIILLIFVPVLTMRLMSEEKQRKTDQLLLTAPVSLFGIVAGKFLSAYIVFLLGITVLPVYGIVLSNFVGISWLTLWGNFIGIALLGMVYVSLGLFVSALTENQMIAAIGSIFLNLTLIMFNALAFIVEGELFSNMFMRLSAYDRYMEFTVGIFKLSNVMFFISMAAVFLFLTMRVVERRRWA